MNELTPTSLVNNMLHRMKDVYKNQEIPRNSFLIWFGKEIPKKIETGTCSPVINYRDNIFIHYECNQNYTIKLIVSKKLMEETYYEELEQECREKHVVLVNFDDDESLKKCLNRDIVEKFLENSDTYVCASDVLRYSLLFHEGGRYFDLDLQIHQKYEEGLREDFKFDYGFGVTKDGYNHSMEVDHLISVKNHIFFLLLSAAVRYYSNKLNDENNLSWRNSRELFRKTIMGTTGAPINHFCGQPVTSKVQETSHHTSLFGLSDNEERKVVLDNRIECPYVVVHGHSWASREEKNAPLTEAMEVAYNQFFKKIDGEIGKGIEKRLNFMVAKAYQYFPECHEFLNGFFLSADIHKKTSAYPDLRDEITKGAYCIFLKFSSEEEALAFVKGYAVRPVYDHTRDTILPQPDGIRVPGKWIVRISTMPHKENPASNDYANFCKENSHLGLPHCENVKLETSMFQGPTVLVGNNPSILLSPTSIVGYEKEDPRVEKKVNSESGEKCLIM